MTRWRTLGFALVLCAGCTADAFVGADPTTDYGVIFDEVWQQFDLHYSFFDLKHVNWDSLGARYRPQAVAAGDDATLANVLGRMLAELDDPHVNLMPTGLPNITHPLAHADTATTFFSSSVVFSQYVPVSQYTSGRHLRYGMAGISTGYVYVADFRGSDWAAELDEALAGMGSATSLLIDVRNNPGGSYDLAVAMAGRFADRDRTFGYIRRRNGPQHSDFTDYMAETVTPAGTRHFPGPVIVLANRRSFSSAEDFVLAMRALPNVSVAGDTTAGASGAPIVRELSNGWTYQLSEWIEYTPAKQTFEGVGLPPNLTVSATAAQLSSGVDMILERALSALAFPAIAATGDRSP